MSSVALTGSKILITGGTGSLGKELVKRFIDYEPEKIIVFSRDEFKQSEMAKDFTEPNIRFFLGDVRDRDRLNQALSGVDYVVHAAALKQVPALEYNPEEAVKTNVNGSMNVIDACIYNKVKKCILISTDKAVNPINLYGATKLCAEKLFIAANAYNKTSFSCVRYGNVIGSRGSVIPLFQKLKEQGAKKLPVTSPDMTRFWITLDEAVDLVMIALMKTDMGKIIVPRAPAMSMADLARAIIPDCEIEVIGVRAGEKIHESLISEDSDNVVMVGNDSIYKTEPYTSDIAPMLTREEFLEKLKGKKDASE